jgi:hypothetical protein
MVDQKDRMSGTVPEDGSPLDIHEIELNEDIDGRS